MRRFLPLPAAKHASRLLSLALASGLTILTACGGDQQEAKPESKAVELATSGESAPEPESGDEAGSLLKAGNDAALTEREMVEKAVEEAETLAMKARQEAEAAATNLRDKDLANKLQREAETAEKRAQALAEAALLEEQRRKTAAGVQPPAPPSGNMTALPPQLQDPLKKAQALNAELHQAKTRLQQLHQQALQAPAVLASQDKLEAAALEEIEKISPGITPEWRRFKALITEMEQLRQTVQPGQLPQGIQGMMMEMEKLSAKISPLQMKVSELPTIQNLKADFAAAVDAELLRLDPKAADLKARHEAIVQELNNLRGELSRLQGRVAPHSPSGSQQPDAAAPKN